VVKRLGREAGHSPPPSAEVKEWVELYLHSPITSSWRGVHLKHGGNFTFTFTGQLLECQLMMKTNAVTKCGSSISFLSSTTNAQQQIKYSCL
jgi:hypothetical protein